MLKLVCKLKIMTKKFGENKNKHYLCGVKIKFIIYGI